GMSQRRYISTEISVDTALNRLIREAGAEVGLFYTWLIPWVGDDAIVYGNPESLRAQIYPLRHDICVEDVEYMLSVLHNEGFIYWNQEDRQVLFHPDKFYKYQTPVQVHKRRTDHPTSPSTLKVAPTSKFQQPYRSAHSSGRHHQASASASASASALTSASPSPPPPPPPGTGESLSSLSPLPPNATVGLLEKFQAVWALCPKKDRVAENLIKSVLVKYDYLPLDVVRMDMLRVLDKFGKRRADIPSLWSKSIEWTAVAWQPDIPVDAIDYQSFQSKYQELVDASQAESDLVLAALQMELKLGQKQGQGQEQEQEQKQGQDA
ncbi:MAG: hypothetical protein ACREBW_05665, partial [Candidatus Micrarchaeaceae archaeon]